MFFSPTILVLFAVSRFQFPFFY